MLPKNRLNELITYTKGLLAGKIDPKINATQLVDSFGLDQIVEGQDLNDWCVAMGNLMAKIRPGATKEFVLVDQKTERGVASFGYECEVFLRYFIKKYEPKTQK